MQSIHPPTQSLSPFDGQDVIRSILGANLGQTLTPEIAAAIEMDLRRSLEPMKAKIERLESATKGMEPADCPVRHHFAPGVCLREITIKAGTVVTGAVHKKENLIIVSMGALRIAKEGGWIDVHAGETLRCMPGQKNAVYALEDSRWTNVLPTDETSVEKIVEEFTFSTADELLGGTKNAQALAFQRTLETEV